MGDQPAAFEGSDTTPSAIDSLARQSNIPVDAVRELYRREHARLDVDARIKVYLPVLAGRRVRALLQGEAAAGYRP